jgi:adenine C2-methylase RlmN of 23S rRNA A2503 and tRNA A37
LTTTKQTKFEDVTAKGYVQQARHVLKHYVGQAPAKYAHLNFMARGEALANRHMLENADSILWQLGQEIHVWDEHLGVRYNMSTIMPRSLDRELTDVFKIIHPTIYYSLYSANKNFRGRWMPGAMDLDKALDMLVRYQEFSRKRIKIHHCFIRGENDSLEDLEQWIDKLNVKWLDWDFNLVRYNPYSEVQGAESTEDVIARNLNFIEQHCPGDVKMIPRVGYDVHASCGMFVEN